MDKVQRAWRSLGLRTPYIAYILWEVKLIKDNRFPIAATNGDHVYYNDRLNEYDPQAIRFVLAHELGHILAGHTIIPTPPGYNSQIWTLACEYMANHIAHNIFEFDIPDDPEPVYNKKYTTGKWLTNDIYQDLIKDTPKVKIPVPDFIFNPKPNKLTQEKLQEIRIAIKNTMETMNQHGSVAGDALEQLNRFVIPDLPYAALLEQWMGCIDENVGTMFKRFKRRHIVNGLYLPHRASEKFNIGIAIDTSGSMSTEELEEAIGTIVGIAQNYETSELNIWACDTVIQKHIQTTVWDMNIEQLVKELPKGRGGTDFRPVFEEIEKKGIEIDGLIYITDLGGDFPDEPPDYPVVWIIKKALLQAPFGETIKFQKILEEVLV